MSKKRCKKNKKKDTGEKPRKYECKKCGLSSNNKDKLCKADIKG